MSGEAKPTRRLVDTVYVGETLDVAPETVRRLTDRGAIPMPVRLGRSVRYRLAEIEKWIADDCPDLSKGGQR